MSSTSISTDSKTFVCYPHHHFQVCIPLENILKCVIIRNSGNYIQVSRPFVRWPHSVTVIKGTFEARKRMHSKRWQNIFNPSCLSRHLDYQPTSMYALLEQNQLRLKRWARGGGLVAIMNMRVDVFESRKVQMISWSKN